MHLGERESAILCVKILFPMRIHFTQNERVELHFTQNERVELRKRYRRRKTHGTLRKPQLANLPSRRGLYTDLWGNSEMNGYKLWVCVDGN